MYRITHEGQIIDICDKVNYIRVKPETGCFINTDKEHAEGIGVRGTAYSIPGHVLYEGAPEAFITEISDGGQYMFDELKKAQIVNGELTAGVTHDKATQNYPEGEYIIMNNTLYVVIDPIARGENFVVGENIKPTTVMQEVNELKGEA